MRRGVRLGLDPGDARVGVASCDPGGVLATPLETLQRGKGDLTRVRQLVRELEPMEIVIGLPRSLGGGEGPAAAKVRKFAARISRIAAPVPVRLVDERLTTVTAEDQLRQRGRKGADRRAVVDMAAATVILQHALDTERASGEAPGEIVEDVND